MKQQGLAVVLIGLAMVSGMLLTAATSGCDGNQGKITVSNVATLPADQQP